ncbi:hypothetical protein ACUY2V_02545, partial [Corynebacterium tuberculostearicum]
DATPADCGVANINYERKPLAVPGTRNTGTNYADSRYQLPQIDSSVLGFGFATADPSVFRDFFIPGPTVGGGCSLGDRKT